MRLALFEPDIPQNAGAVLRLAACLGLGADLIGPLGFVWNDRKLRRAGMDYLSSVDLRRHDSWTEFAAAARRAGHRLVLLTTRAETPYLAHDFDDGDVLILGRESAGMPDVVHRDADARIRIPLAPGMRSLNVATAAALVAGEALRQTCGFPGDRQQRAAHGR